MAARAGGFRGSGSYARGPLIAASIRSPIPVATRRPARMCGPVDPLLLDSVRAEVRRPATRAMVPRLRTVYARFDVGLTRGP